MRKLNFLFWNVKGNEVTTEIVALAKTHAIDILALAEFKGDEKHLLRAFYHAGYSLFSITVIGCRRIKLFSKLQPECFSPKFADPYVTSQAITIHFKLKLLVFFLHLPSKQYAKEDDQLEYLKGLREEIETTRKESKINNIILLGDFNVNPFEKGMILASAMNAVACAYTAKKINRTIKNKTYRFFYNPMWNLFGDADKKPGTYFYNAATQVNYFWNMFDQVLLSPELIDYFELDSLKIINSVANKSLVKRESFRPDANISDHLPIYFSLKLDV
jgi:exonuclease III